MIKRVNEFSNKFIDSKAKVDIVVTLPQNPMPTNVIISTRTIPILNKAKTNPRMNEPKMLATKVPIGIPDPVGNNNEMKYRTRTPGIAPSMTNTKLADM